MSEVGVQTPATKQAFESALLSAKLRGRIDLEDYAAENEKAATASDADLQAMTDKLNQDLPQQQGKKSLPPSGPTITLWLHTLGEAGRLGVIQAALVAQYQHRAGATYTEENYLALIDELEAKIAKKK